MKHRTKYIYGCCGYNFNYLFKAFTEKQGCLEVDIERWFCD